MVLADSLSGRGRRRITTPRASHCQGSAGLRTRQSERAAPASALRAAQRVAADTRVGRAFVAADPRVGRGFDAADPRVGRGFDAADPVSAVGARHHASAAALPPSRSTNGLMSS